MRQFFDRVLCALFFSLTGILISQSFLLAQSDRHESLKDQIFLEMKVQKETVYIHEQVLLTIKLFSRGLSPKDIEYPVFRHDGFVKTEYDNPVHGTETVRGLLYDTVQFKAVLHGTKSGDLRLGPALLRCTIPAGREAKSTPSSYFGDSETDRLELQSREISMKVLPLPEKGRPAVFSGAVGKYVLTVEMDPKTVDAGKPVTLRMRIEGKGNFNTVRPPGIEAQEDIKLYEPQTSQKENRKMVEQVILIESERVKEIPAVRFSFFDPEKGSYHTVVKGPFSIHVTKPQRGELSAFVRGNLIYIKESPGHLRKKGTYLYMNRMFLLLHLLPLLLVASIFLVRRHQERMRSDEDYGGARRARRAARKGMRDAEEVLKQGKVVEFFDCLFRTLQACLGNRFHIPPVGITGAIVCEILKKGGLEGERCSRLKSIFDQCDLARYGSSGFTKAQMEDIFSETKGILGDLEKQKRFSARTVGVSKTILIFFLSLFAVQVSSSEPSRKQDPEYTFYKATSLYEAERYDEAITEYTLLLKRGIESGPLYYNLGNCYFKKGEKGKAILNYERAGRIIPYDSDLAANDAYARSMVTRDDAKTAGPWYRKAVDSLTASMTIDGLTILLSVIYIVFLLTLVASWYVRSSKRRSTALFIALGIFFVLTGMVLYQKVDLIDREAIVIAERTEVKFEPFDRATDHSTLYEGTKVKVLLSKKDWVKIEGTDKKVGWVKASSIETL